MSFKKVYPKHTKSIHVYHSFYVGFCLQLEDGLNVQRLQLKPIHTRLYQFYAYIKFQNNQLQFSVFSNDQAILVMRYYGYQLIAVVLWVNLQKVIYVQEEQNAHLLRIFLISHTM